MSKLHLVVNNGIYVYGDYTEENQKLMSRWYGSYYEKDNGRWVLQKLPESYKRKYKPIGRKKHR